MHICTELGLFFRVKVLLVHPVVKSGVCLGLCVANALSQDAGEFFGLSTQSGDIIFGEFAPPLPYLTLEFMPLAQYDIVV
jgi:hypothetical protein